MKMNIWLSSRLRVSIFDEGVRHTDKGGMEMNCKKCVYYLKMGSVGICKLAQLPIKNHEPHFKCPLERDLPKILKEEQK